MSSKHSLGLEICFTLIDNAVVLSCSFGIVNTYFFQREVLLENDMLRRYQLSCGIKINLPIPSVLI